MKISFILTMLKKPVIKDLHEGRWLSWEKEVLCNRYYDISRLFANLKNTNLTDFSFLKRVKDFSKEQDLFIWPKTLRNWFPLWKGKQWPFLGGWAKWLHWCNLYHCTVNLRLGSGQHLEPNMNTGTKLQSSSRKLWGHLIREPVSSCFHLSIYRI